MLPSYLYCSACGTANREQDTFCFACGRPLQTIAPSQRYPMARSAFNTRIGLLTPNCLLKRRYRILTQIGKGGMGVVYKAEDLLFKNRLVAVKEMSQNGLSPEAIQAFEQEAYLLADLFHPNLPKIHDHFDEAGRWYLVMDFIEGESLEKSLERAPGGRLPLRETLKIGMKLCDVLHYLHSHQPPIIFRDLKPSNVMRTPTGKIYLIDFGIARLFKPGQTRDTLSFGSVGYAAPEQFGKLTTPQSDIYSLGALLHQMLSGNSPNTNTPDPFTFPPLSRVPSQLERLVGQMVQMKAANRPASMTAVKQELQQIAAQLAGKSPLPPRQFAPWEPCLHLSWPLG